MTSRRAIIREQMVRLALTAWGGAMRGASLVAPIVLAVACSEKTDYFGDDDASGNATGNGGSATGATGGTSGSGPGTGGSTGGAGGGPGGTTGSGASGGRAGSGSGGSEAGTGNSPATGGSSQGGSGGDHAGSSASGGESGAGESGTGGTSGTGGASGSSGAGGGAAEGGTSGEGSAGEGGGPGTGGGAGTASGGTVGSGGASGSGGAAAASGSGGTGGCSSNPEYCDGVNNNCTGGVDEGNVCPSGCTGATFEGHAYVLCSTSAGVTWEAALDRCKNTLSTAAGVSLELARVESDGENDFLLDWIDDRSLVTGVWMGANDLDVDNTWAWGTGSGRAPFYVDLGETGEPIGDDVFLYWGDGRPNGDSANDPTEDCGHFDELYGWRWNDRPCGTTLPAYVCEALP